MAGTTLLVVVGAPPAVEDIWIRRELHGVCHGFTAAVEVAEESHALIALVRHVRKVVLVGIPKLHVDRLQFGVTNERAELVQLSLFGVFVFVPEFLSGLVVDYYSVGLGNVDQGIELHAQPSLGVCPGYGEPVGVEGPFAFGTDFALAIKSPQGQEFRLEELGQLGDQFDVPLYEEFASIVDPGPPVVGLFTFSRR